MSETTTTALTLLRLSGAALLTVAGAGAWWAGAHYIPSLLPARGVDDVITVAVLAVGLAVLAWYVLSAAVTLICLLARMAGLVWAGGEAMVRRGGAPAIRRLLGSGAGAILVAGSLLGPAYAQNDEDETSAPASLTWSPTDEPEQDREDPSHTDAPADPAPEVDAPADDPASDDQDPHDDGLDDEPPDEEAASSTADGASETDPAPDATHTVRPGDTLWSLAAADLGESATDAQIAATWPTWYQVNAEVIGTDPDLIIPGQILTHPDGSTS